MPAASELVGDDAAAAPALTGDSVGSGPPIPAMGPLAGSPEPSRLPVASGSGTATPLGPEARAGRAPTQARTS